MVRISYSTMLSFITTQAIICTLKLIQCFKTLLCTNIVHIPRPILSKKLGHFITIQAIKDILKCNSFFMIYSKCCKSCCNVLRPSCANILSIFCKPVLPENVGCFITTQALQGTLEMQQLLMIYRSVDNIDRMLQNHPG